MIVNFLVLNISVTRIVVLTEWNYGVNRKYGILHLRPMLRRRAMQATCQPIQDDNFLSQAGFAVKCREHLICGGGSGGTALKNVYEWEPNHLMEIKSLNSGKVVCSSVYVPINQPNIDGILIVAGGDTNGEMGGIVQSLDIEYLVINDSFRYNEWRVCKDKLPYNIYDHGINILENKLILTGAGHYESLVTTNTEWKGEISFQQELRIKWTPLPPMTEKRLYNLTVVIDDTLYCIGGRGLKSVECFSFATNYWVEGPVLPFTLYMSKCVVNPITNHCFILGGSQDRKWSTKVYLFDPKKGLIDVQGETNMARCTTQIAVLL